VAAIVFGVRRRQIGYSAKENVSQSKLAACHAPEVELQRRKSVWLVGVINAGACSMRRNKLEISGRAINALAELNNQRNSS